VHLQVESADPVERLCVMERIDRLLIKPLAEMATGRESRRLLVVIDGRGGPVPWIAIGHGLPRRPIARLTSEAFAGSPLQFRESTELHAWLTRT